MVAIGINGQKYYSVAEAAALTGYNDSYFRAKLRKGHLPRAIKRRGQWLVPDEDVQIIISNDPMLSISQIEMEEIEEIEEIELAQL